MPLLLVIPMFLIFLAVFAGGQIYVFWRLWKMLPTCHWLWWTLLATSILCFLALIMGNFIGSFKGGLPISFISALYKIGNTWFFVFLEVMFFMLIADLIGLIFPTFKIQFWQIASIVSLMMVYGYINYFYPKKVELNVENPYKETLQANSLKIIFISDLHLGYGTGNKELKKWVKRINDEKPDLLLIGGDVIDNSITPLNKKEMYLPFQEIKTRYGIYGVLGNHEYISQRGRNMKNSTDEQQSYGYKAQVPDVEEFYRKAGIKLLRDSAITIDNRLIIIGRDDYSNKNRLSIKQLLDTSDINGSSASLPTIVLDHQPQTKSLQESIDNGIFMQLSGHTHAGQLVPINWVTALMYKINHGYKQIDGTNFYVTSGLGIWGGKFRIGTNSEYVVITL